MGSADHVTATIVTVAGQCDGNYVFILCIILIMSERQFEMCQVKPYFVNNTEGQWFLLVHCSTTRAFNVKSDYRLIYILQKVKV